MGAQCRWRIHAYLTNGYWTVTQYGNTWVSNYDWAVATFHYGRWFWWVRWLGVDTRHCAGTGMGCGAMVVVIMVGRNVAPAYNFSVSFNLFNNIPNNYWCFVPQQYVWRPLYIATVFATSQRVHREQHHIRYALHGEQHYIQWYYYTPSHAEITHT